MKFTVEGVTYEMVQENITFAEARAIEKITGHTFAKMTTDPEIQGSMQVTQALMWVSMKRSQPDLTFYDLDDMEIGSLEVDDDEAAPEVPTEGDEATTSAPDA